MAYRVQRSRIARKETHCAYACDSCLVGLRLAAMDKRLQKRAGIQNIQAGKERTSARVNKMHIGSGIVFIQRIILLIGAWGEYWVTASFKSANGNEQNLPQNFWILKIFRENFQLAFRTVNVLVHFFHSIRKIKRSVMRQSHTNERNIKNTCEILAGK
jgi:hypothetical protein